MLNPSLVIIPILTGLACLCILFLWLLHKRKHRREELEEMDGHDFEYYCADILARAGFQEIQVTKGSGDFGADILAQKDGITYAVQCKCYDGPVGIHAIQEVYAGKDYYDRMAAAVMTNQYFTSPAVKIATKLHVLLWDRGFLEEVLEETSDR